MSGGVIVVFIALGKKEQALPHQGQEIMLNRAGIMRVMETLSDFVGEKITLIQFPERQAAGIWGYPATIKLTMICLKKRLSKAS